VLAWLETGRLLEAKGKLGHGRFQFMVARGYLPFDKRMAEMFMSIARNPVLSNAQHVALLPGAMSTLYELSRIEPEILEAKIIDGTITPQLQRADVKRLFHKPDTEPDQEPATTTANVMESVVNWNHPNRQSWRRSWVIAGRMRPRNGRASWSRR
jgi:hypothetical protein